MPGTEAESEEKARRQSTPSPIESVRSPAATPRKQRMKHRTNTIYPRRQAQARNARPPRTIIHTEEIVEGAMDGAVFTAYYMLDIFKTAVRLLRKPLAVLLFLSLFSIILSQISHIIRGAFAPLCYMPGLHSSPICRRGTPNKNGNVPRWADYEKLVQVQSKSFEQLLDESVGDSGLTLKIKKAEMATTDLVTLVRVSQLKTKDMLAESLLGFVEDARKTGRGLQKLTSKVGGAVDRYILPITFSIACLKQCRGSIMAVNEHALHTIEAANANIPLGLSIQRLWYNKEKTDSIVTSTFTNAMATLSSHMSRLMLEAEHNLANLDRLEERLSTLHEMVSREDSSISAEKAELLAELWTILGGNKGKLRGFDNHLLLLKSLETYRKEARVHVVAALHTLQEMSADMEDLRERVAAPELTGPKVPLEVHMKSIKHGLERLKEGKIRATRLSQDAARRTLGIEED